MLWQVIEAHPSFYESISGGLPDIRKRVEALQRKFNEESKAVKLELVLFTDALMHMMRISRLLAMDRGSALLVGVGGSGKQSLSRLAAYIAGESDTFQHCPRGGRSWLNGTLPGCVGHGPPLCRDAEGISAVNLTFGFQCRFAKWTMWSCLATSHDYTSESTAGHS